MKKFGPVTNFEDREQGRNGSCKYNNTAYTVRERRGLCTALRYYRTYFQVNEWDILALLRHVKYVCIILNMDRYYDLRFLILFTFAFQPTTTYRIKLRTTWPTINRLKLQPRSKTRKYTRFPKDSTIRSKVVWCVVFNVLR